MLGCILEVYIFPTGKVTYNVQGFVDKNRDAQQDVFFDLMNKSTNKFIADITRFQVNYPLINEHVYTMYV